MSWKDLVSVLIPTRNRRDLLIQSIQNIRNSTHKNVEIIVVDDASTDETQEIIPKEFPDVKFMRLEEARGPARARDVGLAHAQGQYVLFLDDDCSLEPTVIEGMIKVFEKNPSVGAVVFKITNVKTGEVLTRNCPSECKQLWTGASAVRKDVIDRIGKFSKFAFFHGDEFDYSVRIWDSGFKIHYDPSLEAFDFADGRGGRVSSWRIREIKSWLLVFANNFPFRIAVVFSIRALVSYGFLALRNWRLLDYIWGIGKAVFEYPQALRERRLLSPETLCLYTNSRLPPDTFNIPIYRKIFSRSRLCL